MPRSAQSRRTRIDEGIAYQDQAGKMWMPVDVFRRVRDERDRCHAALHSIKARCDKIVAGEFGGLEAALEISNEARRALRGASDQKQAGSEGA